MSGKKPEQHVDSKLKAIIAQFLALGDPKAILSVDDIFDYISSLREYSRVNTKSLRRSIIKGNLRVLKKNLISIEAMEQLKKSQKFEEK